MKPPDTDRIRSERRLPIAQFIDTYNENLPETFPRATHELLKEFQRRYPGQFKEGAWSLDRHRKKVMDWLPMHLKSLEHSRASVRGPKRRGAAS